jgi:hypothetical protein
MRLLLSVYTGLATAVPEPLQIGRTRGIQEGVIMDQRSFDICKRHTLAAGLPSPVACASKRFDNAAGLFLFSAESISREQASAPLIAFRKLRTRDLQHVLARML